MSDLRDLRGRAVRLALVALATGGLVAVGLAPAHGQGGFGAGLVGWWQLDEGGGAIAGDSSGLGNDGGLSGDVVFTSDALLGSALDFTGPDGIVVVPHDATLEPETGTFEAWIKVSELQDADIMGKTSLCRVRTDPTCTETVGFSVYGLRLRADGGLVAFIANDDPVIPALWATVSTPPALVIPGEWAHVAIRWDGASFDIFVNGALEDQTTYDPVPGTGLSYFDATPFFLGGATAGPHGGEFIGQMDDVRLYARARPDVEILTDYRTKGHKPAKPPGSSDREQSQPPRPETIDDLFAKVAERVPAFGGMFFDDGEVLHVHLTDPSPRMVARTRQALREVFPRDRFLDPLLSGRIAAVQGRYGFLDLKAWHDQLAEDVLAMDGVTMTDIDDRRNRVQIGVDNPESERAVEDHVSRSRIPAEAVEVVTEEAPSQGSSLRDFHRPLVGGLQIQSDSGKICTLGFNAVRFGFRGFVTNSHCTNLQGGVEGTLFSQPDLGAVANRVATETVDPRYFPCEGWSRRCRFSDSAFAALDPGVRGNRGHIARTGAAFSTAWNGVAMYRVVWELPWTLVGLNVTKEGRTTGRTEGEIWKTCVNTNVADTNITLLCQARALYFASSGDSGSPVFFVGPNGTDVALMGINWSGSPFGVFSTLDLIEQELGPLTTCAVGFGC